MFKFKKKIRIFSLGIIILLALFFLFQYISPSGTWTCQKTFKKQTRLAAYLAEKNFSCLADPSPGERVDISSSGTLLIKSDPVYFSVFSPRPFSKLDLEIVYKSKLDQASPIFEAGFLVEKDLWRYQLKPVYNYYFEELFSDWDLLSFDKFNFWQRNRDYKTYAEFQESLLNNPQFCKNLEGSSKDCLAIYKLSQDTLGYDFKEEKNSQKAQVSLKNKLQGTHQFYIYLKDGDLEISAELFNKSKDSKKENISLPKFNLYQGSKIIHEFNITEDLDVSFSLANLEPGLYRLEFKAKDDWVLSSLELNSAYLSIINHINLFDDFEAKLYTDSSHLQIKASSPEFTQDILFNDNVLEIDEPYKQYVFKVEARELNAINLDKANLSLANNGVFAFSPDELINPNFTHLDQFLDNEEKIDYIVANYDLVRMRDDFLLSNLEFDSSLFYREKGNYNLLFSIPGLDLDSEAYIEIKEIRLRFHGSTLIEKIKSFFKRN